MINFLVSEVIDITDYSCENSTFFPFFNALKFVVVVIQIAVPFALVIWGSLDFFKALIAGDEKEMRIKRKPFIQRVVAAVIIFLLPILLQVISTQMAGADDANNFWKCYSEAKAKIDFSSIQNGSGSSGGSGNSGGSGGSSSKGSGTSYTSGGTSNAKGCTSYTSKSTCKTDDYGNTCEWYVAKKTKKKKTYKCRVKPEKAYCSDYTSGGESYCNMKRDDEGNQCQWNRNSGNCFQKDNKQVCTDYNTEKECMANDARDDYGNKCKWDRVMQVNTGSSSNPQYTFKCLTK